MAIPEAPDYFENYVSYIRTTKIETSNSRGRRRHAEKDCLDRSLRSSVSCGGWTFDNDVFRRIHCRQISPGTISFCVICSSVCRLRIKLKEPSFRKRTSGASGKELKFFMFMLEQ
jgi:hypothetical protein